MGNRWRLLGVLALVVPLVSATCAEPVPDPTQPPAGWIESKSDSSPEETTAETDSGSSQPLVLESIIDGLGRKLAIISGQRVSEGEHVRDYRIRRITGSKVELVGEAGVRVLRLFPNSQDVKERQP